MLDSRQRFYESCRDPNDGKAPLCSAWIHFGSDHLSTSRLAGLHADFQEAFNWDFMKVMHDYRPLSAGPVQAASDALSCFAEARVWHSFEMQLDLIRKIRDRVGPDLPLMETVFSPIAMLTRSAGARLLRLRQSDPDIFAALVGRITESTMKYSRLLVESGHVDSVLFATNDLVAPDFTPRFGNEDFERFVGSPDRRILQELSSLIRVLHAHGREPVVPSRVRAYEFEVFSLPGSPYTWNDVAYAAGKPGRPFLGGFGLSVARAGSVDDVRAHVDAVIAAGIRPIWAPECTLPSSTQPWIFRAIREAALQAR